MYSISLPIYFYNLTYINIILIYCPSLGYKVVTMWEHEFKEEASKNEEMRDFIALQDLESRLDPRESFFGGRTNACRLFYEAGPDETIRYADFTSLYPYVNKYARYPVGHPQVVTCDFQPLDTYFGIAKVKIIAFYKVCN